MNGEQESIWVFGYGSLIWWAGEVKTIERQEGILHGWHREWTWISSTRHGAPTCSLGAGGQVKGVFLHLNPFTAKRDLGEFRRRENAKTEEIRADIPTLGARTYFWTMGNNLDRFPEFATNDDIAESLFGVVSSFNSEGYSSCKVTANTNTSPNITQQNVWIDCGEKTILVKHLSMQGKSENWVSERLGKWRESSN